MEFNSKIENNNSLLKDWVVEEEDDHFVLKRNCENCNKEFSLHVNKKIADTLEKIIKNDTGLSSYLQSDKCKICHNCRG